MLVKEITLLSEKEAIKSAGNAVVNSIESSKSLAGKTLWGVNNIVVPLAIAYQIYDGWSRILAIPKNLDPEDYEKQVYVIISELIAEFGLGFVSAELGALLAGVVGSAVFPGVGTAAMALAGFIAGGVAGFTAEHFLGADARSIARRIVYTLYQKPKNTVKYEPKDLSHTGLPGDTTSSTDESIERLISLSTYKS